MTHVVQIQCNTLSKPTFTSIVNDVKLINCLGTKKIMRLDVHQDGVKKFHFEIGKETFFDGLVEGSTQSAPHFHLHYKSKMTYSFISRI